MLHACHDARAGALARLDVPSLHPIHLGAARHWVKLRPGAEAFIAGAAPLFEIGVYTHGTRVYAEECARLLDPDGSGLLVSSFTMQAGMGDGPEGSSIWLASTALAVVLPELAQERARLREEPRLDARRAVEAGGAVQQRPREP